MAYLAYFEATSSRSDSERLRKSSSLDSVDSTETGSPSEAELARFSALLGIIAMTDLAWKVQRGSTEVRVTTQNCPLLLSFLGLNFQNVRTIDAIPSYSSQSGKSMELERCVPKCWGSFRTRNSTWNLDQALGPTPHYERATEPLCSDRDKERCQCVCILVDHKQQSLPPSPPVV